MAQAATEAGKVRLNGTRLRKPAHAVRPGDILTLALGGRVQVVKVLALATCRGRPDEARLLYEIAE